MKARHPQPLWSVPALLAAVAILSLLAAATPAAADFSPIRLVSKGSGQPADRADGAALSADGRYLAFEGVLAGFEGVFREDLASGQIVRVAGVSAYAPNKAQLRAEAPSISADGRFVSFTTQARLDPANDLGATSRDVYVADLAAVPPGGEPVYELASARDGCDPGTETGCGLEYEGPGGSESSGRVALSADGTEVAFLTSAPSDLTSGLAGSTPGVETPAGQVVVRDLATETTTLVSGRYDSGSAQMTEEPVPGGALLPAAAGLPLLRGAALSGDGTTVAWIGAHLEDQVPLAEPERKRIEEVDAGAFPYDEPLWRRIADGPTAPTRRVIGGAEADAPFPDLTQKDTGNVNSAQGWIGAANVDGVPRLTADGRTVLLIGNPTEATNLFEVDMAPGLSRAQAVRQLTREVVVDPSNVAGSTNVVPNVPQNGHIFDADVSPDGSRIAFATARQRFPLAPPNLIGSPPASPGLVELYLIDRESEALERVTHGDGSPEEASGGPAFTLPESEAVKGIGAATPSLSDGPAIAFSSDAANLVPEDSNEASDVFVVEDLEGPRVPGFSTISPGPTAKRKQSWRLALRAFSLQGGAVRIVAWIPAPGRLRAAAKPESDSGVAARRLATGVRRAGRGGRVQLTLVLPRRLRRLARSRQGLYGTAEVSFRGRGGRPLHGSVPVRFHARPKRGRG